MVPGDKTGSALSVVLILLLLLDLSLRLPSSLSCLSPLTQSLSLRKDGHDFSAC